MRSSGGTNVGLAWSVVAATNARIACFAGPSFHEASGSVWARAGATNSRTAQSAKATANQDRLMPVKCLFIIVPPVYLLRKKELQLRSQRPGAAVARRFGEPERLDLGVDRR